MTTRTTRLPTAQEMQALDRCAIDQFGIPGVVLMENAGSGTVRLMTDQFGPCDHTFACIVVGPGNNGGDGLVIGRHLHQLGCMVVFFLLVPPDSFSGDAAINMEVVRRMGLPIHVIDQDELVPAVSQHCRELERQGFSCYAIVDAIFGTGLAREVTGRFRKVIELINSRDFGHTAPVVAADCPSGMNADTGKAMGVSIRADLTATYGFAKPGHFLHDGPDLTGHLEVIEISIPHAATERHQISTELIDGAWLKQLHPILRRQRSSHKGNHGHLLIAAGSAGKTGAAILSARGGLRGGSGLVSLAVPQAINLVLETSLWEAMTVPLKGTGAIFLESHSKEVTSLAANKDAAVIGPGLGAEPETAAFVRQLYHTLPIPLVVDADAINILAADPGEAALGHTPAPRIFTPHPGELSRLIGWSTQEIQANRREAAIAACNLINNGGSTNIMVLKGANTLVCSPGRPLAINRSGNPGMATGGMGDVLSGLIGALLCQGCQPFEAAAGAVYLHGSAADQLNIQMGAGYSASEVADRLPQLIRSLLAEP